MWQRDQTSNWNIKEHFPQHEEGINITNNKYVYKTAFTEVLRVVHFTVRMWKLDCMLVREWNRSLKLQKCGFYGVCCVLHGLMKCQRKSPISWRLLLTDKSDLWDTSWEAIGNSWKRSRWPGWSKARARGRQRKTFMDWLSFACGEQWMINNILKICQERNEHIILIGNVRVWRGTYTGLDWSVYRPQCFSSGGGMRVVPRTADLLVDLVTLTFDLYLCWPNTSLWQYHRHIWHCLF